MGARRILFAGGGTGGHLYPALNLADALRRVDPTAQCFFLGSHRGLEARVLPTTGYEFRLLPLEPLYRSRPWRNWRLLASAPAVVRGELRAVRGPARPFARTVVGGLGEAAVFEQNCAAHAPAAVDARVVGDLAVGRTVGASVVARRARQPRRRATIQTRARPA